MNRITSRTSGAPPAAETASSTAPSQHGQPAQPSLPRARKTSQLPGSLRGLADKFLQASRGRPPNH